MSASPPTTITPSSAMALNPTCSAPRTSERGGQGERVHGPRAAAAQLSGGQGDRAHGPRAAAARLTGDQARGPAGEADVVHQQARRGRRRAGDGELAADV